MSVKINITIIEINSLNKKINNIFKEIDSVIHILIESKNL